MTSYGFLSQYIHWWACVSRLNMDYVGKMLPDNQKSLTTPASRSNLGHLGVCMSSWTVSLPHEVYEIAQPVATHQNWKSSPGLTVQSLLHHGMIEIIL